MASPLVSICLPNLNTRPYLPERVDCILAQTCQDWELVISDNFSDDGAWEFFRELAGRDSRVLTEQAPRTGLYPNWNRCVERARGRYLYIATSDDTMAPDCLEKMVAALERNPSCGLALCPLRVIDEQGREVPQPKWPDCSAFSRDLGDLRDRPHIHRAPYDGLLHLLGSIIYNSITQLLIRRDLFSRVGGFSGRWGSVGDFHWEMKASLVTDTVYVPDTWGSWRVHAKQATAFAALMSEEHFRKVDEMIADAVQTCAPLLPPEVAAGIANNWLPAAKDIRSYYAGLRNRPSALSRRFFQLRHLLAGTNVTRREALRQFSGNTKWPDSAPAEFRAWLERIGRAPAFTSAG